MGSADADGARARSGAFAGSHSSDGAHASHPHTLRERVTAAGGAAGAAALVTNPLDVVKTRMQAQAAQRAVLSSRPAVAPAAVQGVAGCECAALSQRSYAVQAACHGQRADSCGIFRGTLDALRKIIRKEGLIALWRGTPVALAMAVPQVGIYLPAYEGLRASLESATPLGSYGGGGVDAGGSAATAVIAGSVARALSVVTVAPLERARTRAQASVGGGRCSTLRQVLPFLPSSSGANAPWRAPGSVGESIRSMWRGTAATIARDVPFSAIYWVAAERLRGHAHTFLAGEGGDGIGIGMGSTGAGWEATAAANLYAGSLAGALAGALTTPLDVAKTRIQMDLGSGPVAAGAGAGRPAPSVLRLLGRIAREEGVDRLFSGAMPRAARAAPACAIVLTSYEVLKLIV